MTLTQWQHDHGDFVNTLAGGDLKMLMTVL